MPAFAVIIAVAMHGTHLAAVTDGAYALCEGMFLGYAIPFAAATTIGTTSSLLKRSVRAGRRPTKQHHNAIISETTSVEGKWVLDAAKSESVEPFLVAVGAPRLIAKMVGTKGKPVQITIDGDKEVSVRVEGKDAEQLTTQGSSVSTPRGDVRAVVTRTKSRDGWSAFRVVKKGPAEAEVTTEERELIEDGRAMRCTFTHSRPGQRTVTVVRYYLRAA